VTGTADSEENRYSGWVTPTRTGKFGSLLSEEAVETFGGDLSGEITALNIRVKIPSACFGSSGGIALDSLDKFGSDSFSSGRRVLRKVVALEAGDRRVRGALGFDEGVAVTADNLGRRSIDWDDGVIGERISEACVGLTIPGGIIVMLGGAPWGFDLVLLEEGGGGRDIIKLREIGKRTTIEKYVVAQGLRY
jgi:hypothetical protein